MAEYNFAGPLDTENALAKMQRYQQQNTTNQLGQFKLQQDRQNFQNANDARAQTPGIFAGDPTALQTATQADPALASQIQEGAQSALGTLRTGTHAVAAALQNGNKDLANAIYQRVLPLARQHMPNENLPDQLDDATAQKITALSMTMSGGVPVHSIVPNGQGGYTAFDKFGNPIDTGIQAQQKNQIIQDSSGNAYGINRNTLETRPVIMGGQPAPQTGPQPLLTPQNAPPIQTSIPIPPQEQAAFNAARQANDAGKPAAFSAVNGGAVPVDPQTGQTLTNAPGAQLNLGTKQTELDRRIAIAKSMNASPDEIKGMVLGKNGQTDTGAGITPDGQALVASAMSHGYSLPIPNMGFGAAGTAAKVKAINDLAQSFKDKGVAPDDAVSAMISGKTATGGLAALQRTNASVRGWESSAANQADIALEMSNKTDRTGIPAFNRWLLAGRKQLAGDTDVSTLDNATNTLAEEYAKVMGAGNAAATDSQRALAHSMLNSAQTQPQFTANIALMRREMQKRTEGLGSAVDAQLDNIIGKKGAPAGGASGSIPHVTTQAQFDALPAGAVYIEPDGKQYRKPAK